MSRSCAYEDLQVQPYGAHSLHWLIPNPASQRMQSQLLRQAVALALDRQVIVQQVLGLGDDELAGKPLDGPFPIPIGNDKALSLTGRDPRLAAGLIQQELPVPSARQLRLVLPPDPVARRAARAIQQQLALEGLGLDVELAECAAHDLSTGPAAAWDLWYVSWYALDPPVDAARVFGPESLVGRQDTALPQLVQRLYEAQQVDELQLGLQTLQRRAMQHRLIIPLWQLPEYYVVRKSFTAGSARPVTLYEDVHRWRQE